MLKVGITVDVVKVYNPLSNCMINNLFYHTDGTQKKF